MRTAATPRWRPRPPRPSSWPVVQQLLHPDEERVFEAERPEVLVLACGAIAREVLAVIRLNGWTQRDRPLPPREAALTPERIAPAVDAKLHELRWALRASLRRIRGLRHGRRARQGARPPRRRAASRGLTATASSPGTTTWEAMHDDGAGDLLSHRLPAPALRRARRSAASGSTRIRSCCRSISGTTGACVYLAQTDDTALPSAPRARPPIARPRVRGAAHRLRRPGSRP